MNRNAPQTLAHHESATRAWEQLQLQYSRHQNSAPFWDAYQALQSELTRTFPDQHVAVSNLLARIAERLGAVGHAQLLAEPTSLR